MAVFIFDAFRLDTQLYQLFNKGKPISIAVKPFDLLHYLIRHAGRIIPKQELIREVWKADSISESSIPTCISAIRHVLGDPPAAPRFIETHRARGYRFIGKVVESPEPSQPANLSIPHSCISAFVGRDAEMDLLLTALARAARGVPEIVLLTGDAGIGKTRLLEEFAHTAQNRGAEVLFGRCREHDGAPPYWPWIQLFQRHFAANSSTVCSRLDTPTALIHQLLPDSRHQLPESYQPPPIEPERARFRLFDAVSRFLHDLASNGPVALLIDDLHRADPSSLLLLDFLVRDFRNTPLLLAATFRNREISSAAGNANLLSRIINAPMARSLQLSSLSRADVAKVMGKSEQSALASLLHSQSGGNPLLLTHLIHYHEADRYRSLAAKGHTALPVFPVPTCDVISAQLSALPEASARVISAASVIGRDFDLPLLAHTLAVPSSVLLEPLEIACTSLVIEPVLESAVRFRFSHDLLRDVSYARIPRHQRAQLHQQVGIALERLYSANLDEHVDQLAFHFSHAAELGDPTRAIRYTIRAGECAVANLAHENAPGHFRHALEFLDYHDNPDPWLRCEILIQFGAALNRIGQRETARRNLLHAANIAREIGAPTLIARAALTLAPGLFTIEVGTYDHELESLLKDAERRVPASDIDLHVRMNARLALESVWSRDPAACDAYSTQALRLAVTSSDPATKAYALSARHGTLWGAENLERRRHLITEIGALCRQTDDIEIALMYQVLKITFLLEEGSIDAADTEIRSYAKMARDLHHPHAQWYVSLFAAMRYMLQGRFADAATEADRFLILGDRVKDRNAPQSFAVHLIFRHWETDTLNQVMPALDQIASEYPSIVGWQCARAFCLSELRRSEARGLLDYLAADSFAKIPSNETKAISLTMLAIAAVNMKNHERISQLYELLLSGEMHYTVVGYGVLSFGSRARDLGNLAGALGRFDDADQHFQLAISQNERIHSPPWVARSRYDYAFMLAERRDPKYRGSIQSMAREAHQTAKRLGMARLQRETAELLQDL